METTTITTICLILFGVGMTSWALYLWFSDWQPEVRRYMTEEERLEAEIQAAVRSRDADPVRASVLLVASRGRGGHGQDGATTPVPSNPARRASGKRMWGRRFAPRFSRAGQNFQVGGGRIFRRRTRTRAGAPGRDGHGPFCSKSP